ncbi:NUDIX domain-containing protein [Acetobacter conturbans]|uniref:GDP-mannose pyrophosphatase n=1 Tax=Acetobacter conturbans TaxID=1737472 RepID=A0ABX0K090_9PROT|nr:NUDIX domain-containing protein [Acetobacter conturbans]NHN87680.1 NUDIX domain-containing protein [Acetobacter conturbans]
MTRPSIPVTFVPSVPPDLHEKTLAARHFQAWIEKTRSSFDLRSVLVRDVMMFGSRVGFIVVEADARHESARMPCFAVLRGPTVSIMPVITVQGAPEEKHVVLVNEARLPVGEMVAALPAGMVDDGTVDSAALEELQEETGIDLRHASGPPYRLKKEPVFLSPGGSDEEMTLYAVDITLTRDQITLLSGRKMGLASEHEHTTVMVVPFEEVPRYTANAHCLLSWFLYREGGAALDKTGSGNFPS